MRGDNLEPKPGTQPIHQQARDLNSAVEEKLQEQIRTWLEDGVIEPSKSPWCQSRRKIKVCAGAVD